jgi:uncharacterized protein (DUF2252 family)
MVLVAVRPGTAQSAPQGQQQVPAPEVVLLSDSEISVTESGGFAGRVHAVRLTGSNGQVGVEYRAREAGASAPAFTGSLGADRYVTLWRELEAAHIWQIESPKPTAGADLINHEVRIRLGESARVVRWDTARELPPEIRRLSEIADRVLNAGRESAFAR